MSFAVFIKLLFVQEIAIVTGLILSLFFLPIALYLLVLTLLSVKQKQRYGALDKHFIVVVPAHNEEQNIASTVLNLKQLIYPMKSYEIWVIADNCSDETAHQARQAGAFVLIRHNLELRGKGYALNEAFSRILQLDRHVDAVVVVDADTIVDPYLLQAFAASLNQGEKILQAEYAVRNPYASWRTRLLVIALSMFHRLRSLAREFLGVSTGLRGNGMCFALDVLRSVPHQAAGLVEDVEYTIELGLRGFRVSYVDSAKVYGEMVSGAKASESQRLRWEEGRKQLKNTQAPRLWQEMKQSKGFSKTLLLFDLWFDVWIPPLASIVLWVTLGYGWQLSWQIFSQHDPANQMAVFFLNCGELALQLWHVQIICLLMYVVRGVILSEQGLGGFLILLCAPWYILWKIFLRLKRPITEKTWIRTQRENEPP